MEYIRKILIVEDDEIINNLICKILTKEGYEVKQAFSGTEGRLLLNMFNFELVLLDLMLPGMKGEDLINEIRIKSNVPIIVISAKISSLDKVNALKLGADDFVSKPFDVYEVIARVEAQLRRYIDFSEDKKENKVFKYKELVLNRESVEVLVMDKKLQLTAKEFHIIELLISNPTKVFTRANLFEQVWEGDFLGDDNTVNVHISNLRSKIAAIDAENQYIKTVWGIGFKLGE